jgi:hypothetical protein
MPRGVRTDRISERDLQVLEFIARFGVVPREAVSIWADTRKAVTHARERRLRLVGLIEIHPRIGPHGPFAIATRAGLRLCGYPELHVARLSYGELSHQVLLMRLAVQLERQGDRLLSEREMLARERAAGERIHSAALSGRRHHRPDLLRLCGDNQAPEAIELELAVKGAGRLDQIIRAWRRAVAERRISRVVYVCSPPARRALKRAVARTRAAAQIHIEPLSVDDSGDPSPYSGEPGPRAAASVLTPALHRAV